jgi:hypothetical protein
MGVNNEKKKKRVQNEMIFTVEERSCCLIKLFFIVGISFEIRYEKIYQKTELLSCVLHLIFVV